MGAIYLWGSLQFLAFLLLGLPFGLALMRQDKNAIGWLLLTPAFGVTAYCSAGTGLHSLGLHAAAMFWIMTGLAAAIAIALWHRALRPQLALVLTGVAVCWVGFAISLALNSYDLKEAGLDYFPLTNDDTFAYLGFIDQIRQIGWIEPRLIYPAGFRPLIDHALFIRTPGAILAADFADVFHLETHSAFFLLQRLALPIIALGASGLVIVMTGSWLAGVLCFAPLVFGNILLHQILQQFNSSTLGTIIGTVILAIATWTMRAERSVTERFIGFGLVGWACGALTVTSIEAHLFYLAAFGLVAFLLVICQRQLKKAPIFVAIFIVGYFAASLPHIIKVWPALIAQFLNAGSGHPGDWIASPGFLIQFSGVALTVSPVLGSYAIVPIVAAFIILLALIVAIVALIWGSAGNRVLQTDRLALAAVSSLILALQIYLYVRGIGYGLLKLTDYFAFLSSAVIAVAAFHVGLTRSKMCRSGAIFLIAAYCLIAFIEKQKILDRYRSVVSGMPLLTEYHLPEPGSLKNVRADLSGLPLNLFLYVNRFSKTSVIFHRSESYRFTPDENASSTTPQNVVRLSKIGIPGIPVADITYPPKNGSSVLSVVPAGGNIQLVLPDANWVIPDGEIGRIRRWLSVSGRFQIAGPLPDRARLGVEILPGPDLLPTNRIELYLAGEKQMTLEPSQLPIEIDTLALKSQQTEGEIRIIGRATGIRQIYVGRLRIIID